MATEIFKLTRVSPNRPLAIFKAPVEHNVVLTVEIRNLNTADTTVVLNVTDEYGQALIAKPINVLVPDNQYHRKFNVLCQAGKKMMVVSPTAGIAVRAYVPDFYLKPGQIYLKQNETKEVQVFTNIPGIHAIVIESSISGISLSDTNISVSPAAPTTLTITRDGVSFTEGVVRFRVVNTNLTTLLEIDYDGPAPSSGECPTPSDNECCDPENIDFSPDLAALYVAARDSS